MCPDEGISVSEVIRRALEQYLQRIAIWLSVIDTVTE